jgi:hypothetical protein
METVVIKPQRITVNAHKEIRKKSKKEFRTQQSVICEILDDWAKKQ